MKKRILLKTSLVICTAVSIGFLLTALISVMASTGQMEPTRGMAAILAVLLSVLLVTIRFMKGYGNQILKLAQEREKAHRTRLQKETEKLYENIYEVDITHNCAVSEDTKKYFEALGVPRNTPYDQALQEIASRQIKKEYQEGYVDIFCTENILRAFEDGIETLSYDYLISTDNGYSYYWMRNTTRIFVWEEDQSVRMLSYRRNIDEEKRRELLMEAKMRRDSLSGLYNKAATQEYGWQYFEENQKTMSAFFIFDIDNFKGVNDTYGHVFGDKVIASFSHRLMKQFRENDIVGRIGGDEFVAIIPIPSKEWVDKKAKQLADALLYRFSEGEHSCRITASIGIAIAPEAGTDFETLYQKADSALYRTKTSGKRGYTIYNIEEEMS